MLTSDFGNYSETDSILTTSNSLISELNSESSDFQGSEIDTPENVNNSGSASNERKIKNKSRSRVQKKVKYWTLPTMSSGTFNPSMLTARQQLQYLAQKSKLGEESDSLELSPLRLDRIKFEEMKSMNGSSSSASKDNENIVSTDTPLAQPSSPSNRNNVSCAKSVRGSKLKEEISSSPTASKSKEAKNKTVRSQSNEKKAKKVKVSEEELTETVVMSSESSESIQRGFYITNSTIDPSEKEKIILDETLTTKDTTIDITSTKNAKKDITAEIVSTKDTSAANISISNDPLDKAFSNPLDTVSINPIGNSFFGNVKSFIFDYQSHHRKHFENFLKDFAKRLGLSPDDEIVKKKREEIINKGMI